MKILIYGAGAIGSIFAAKLAIAGHNVSVLARGIRIEEIRTKGIILVNPMTNKKEIAKVNVIETLLPEDEYDYIIVAMQRTQVDEVLDVLSHNISKSIIFIVNTAAGYNKWVDAVGKERLLLGFPSGGGERNEGEVKYFIGKGIIRLFQTTTFAEYEGIKTDRLKRLIEAFNKAGIPSVISKNMDHWQKTHVAIVTSIANALYKYNSNNYDLAKSYKDIKLMIRGIKEGLAVLNSLGFKTTPKKLNFFKLPPSIIAIIVKIIMGTKLAEIAMAKHTVVAKSELIYLQKEFDELVKNSSIKTPSIDELRKYLLLSQ